MRARVIEVIEVRVGSVRRYFTAAGESIGIVEDASAGMSAEVAQDARPALEPVASAPTRNATRVEELRGELMRRWGDGPADGWVAPPFDPLGPRLEMGAPRESKPEVDE